MLKGNLEADYFLFINGKAVGVLEAKREEINISSGKHLLRFVYQGKGKMSFYKFNLI